MYKQLMILMLLLMVFIILSIAFVTLFERKILGYVQIRKGPNKIFYKGILQPMSDGVKLFLKENLNNLSSNKFIYEMMPYLFFFLMMMFWFTFIYLKQEYLFFSVLVFLLVSGLGVYCLFGSGWASNSKYSLLGAYRSIAQTVSYEVSLIFLILSIFFFINSLNLIKLKDYSSLGLSVGLSFVVLMVLWMVVMIAELNRAPFDFSESESELVSGFNVEYGGGKFAFLFLAEYGNIIFMSYISVEIFMMNSLYVLTLLLIFFIILVRGTFPRYRYDNLMYLNWKVILPFVLMSFFILIYLAVLI